MQPNAQPNPSDPTLRPVRAGYLISIFAGLFGSLALFAGLLFALDKTGHLPPPAFSNSLCTDEKLTFMRDHPVQSPNLLVVGSSVAWRHFDGETIANQMPGTRPLNGAFCGLHANQAVYVANWLLDREASVREVVMIVDPQDFAGCVAVPDAVFNRDDADAYVYGQSSGWLPYMRYFSPASLLRNARTVKAQRADLMEFDPLVFDRYGDGPLNTANSRELFYGQPDPLDNTCFAAIDTLAQRLKREGRGFTVVSTPMHPQWKAQHDAEGSMMNEFDQKLRATLAQTGSHYMNGDAGHAVAAASFIDAIHLRWTAARTFSAQIAARLAAQPRVAGR